MHVHETLPEYLARNRLSGVRFAAIVGVTPTTVYRWIRGEACPQRGILPRVTAATGGSVTANSFYQPPPRA
jgi:hypothetical protein